MARRKRWERLEPTDVTLAIEGMAFMGEGLARDAEGVVFVPYTIPGETVIATMMRRKGPYKEADLKEVKTTAPSRVTARCPYYGQCTGCQWQHIAYPEQLRIKTEIVADQFRRIAGMAEPPVSPTIGCEDPWHYRNHARFTIGPSGQVGFVNKASRRFVRIDHCLIMDKGVNDLLGKLQDKCGETTQLSVRYGVNTGKWLIQPTMQSPEIQVEVGQKQYQDELLGRRFHISSPSFFQVNMRQAAVLIGIVRDRLRLTGAEVLVDAYAGVGTFAALLAPYAKEVIAIEESSSAIADARLNIEGLSNVRLLEARTEAVLASMSPPPDAVILDPPRTGCHATALEALNALRPKRVVYVSCDPASLARDVKVLTAETFELEEAQPVDMFPHTHHIEVVATLRLKS